MTGFDPPRLSEAASVHLVRVIVSLIEHHRRHQIMELTNQAYAEMRANPEIWAEVLDEREVWEATLADGISAPDDPRPESGH